MLKIYGRVNSINVRKVLWGADEIGLAFEQFDWGRGYRPTSDPEFQKLSRFGLIPVVADGDVILRESHSILRYLASKHNRNDLYPTDLVQRANVEAWMDWAGADTATPLRGVFLGGKLDMPPFNAPEFVAKGRADLTSQMRIINDELAGGRSYVAGADFTLADIPVGLVVNRWYSLVPDGPNFAALNDYYDRLSKRPGFKAHGRNGTP